MSGEKYRFLSCKYSVPYMTQSHEKDMLELAILISGLNL